MEGDLAGCVQFPSHRRQRGRRDREGQKAKGCSNLSPRDRRPPPNWAGFQLLVTPSWDPGWLASSRRVTAWGQLPEDTHSTAEPALAAHSAQRCEKQAARSWGWVRRTARPGQCAHLTHTQPSLCPCGWSEPERLRPGTCTKHRACLGQCLCIAPWSLSSVDPGSTRCRERGKPSAVPTLRALPPHTSGICRVPPSPQHHWTREPERVATFTPLCQGRN